MQLRSIKPKQTKLNSFSGPVGKGLQNTLSASLQRGRTPPTCVLDMTLNNLIVGLQLWGLQNTPSLPSLPGPHWAGIVVPDMILSTDQIEVFDVKTVLLLNWILWKRTVFDCVLMLNWIVWHGAVFTFNSVNKKLYLS